MASKARSLETSDLSSTEEQENETESDSEEEDGEGGAGVGPADALKRIHVLVNEIEQAGELKQEKIEKEHEGVNEDIHSLYSFVGLQPLLDDEQAEAESGRTVADIQGEARQSQLREAGQARIHYFLRQSANEGAGRQVSGMEFAHSLLGSALHGDSTAAAMGTTRADLNTLGGGGNLATNLGAAGQKLAEAAEKWSSLIEQFRNVTVLTLGR